MKNTIKPYNILVVEDNIGDFVLLRHHLNSSNFPINKAIHIECISAVPELLKETEPDIILLDLTLPDSTGMDSVIALNRLTPHTPIVVLSGQSTIEVAVEAIAQGAQDYLVKGEYDAKLLAKTLQYSLERKRTTEKLRESNERYEMVNKATRDIIYEWNLITGEVIWNQAIHIVFGYTPADLSPGADTWRDKIHAADKERVMKKIQEYISGKVSKWEEQYRFRCADGTYKHVLDRGHILFNEYQIPYKMIGAMSDMSELIKLEDELLAQKIKQQELIIEVAMQAQEKERNELGRELHDNISQILATVKMYLGLLNSGKSFEEDLLSKSYEYVENAIEELRKLSHSLVAPTLGGAGLRAALEELVNDVNLYNGLKLELHVDKDYKEKDKSKEVMLYRVVQEQLNNITKYAKASKADISLSRENGNLHLSITDNGVGFDTSKKSTGIGLKNIGSRVSFYSGITHIQSAPGEGCRLEITIPG